MSTNMIEMMPLNAKYNTANNLQLEKLSSIKIIQKVPQTSIEATPAESIIFYIRKKIINWSSRASRKIDIDMIEMMPLNGKESSANNFQLQKNSGTKIIEKTPPVSIEVTSIQSIALYMWKKIIVWSPRALRRIDIDVIEMMPLSAKESNTNNLQLIRDSSKKIVARIPHDSIDATPVQSISLYAWRKISIWRAQEKGSIPRKIVAELGYVGTCVLALIEAVVRLPFYWIGSRFVQSGTELIKLFSTPEGIELAGEIDDDAREAFLESYSKCVEAISQNFASILNNLRSHEKNMEVAIVIAKNTKRPGRAFMDLVGKISIISTVISCLRLFRSHPTSNSSMETLLNIQNFFANPSQDSLMDSVKQYIRKLGEERKKSEWKNKYPHMSTN